MGKKPNADEINFNYPIPKTLHKQVRQLSLDADISVKDIVINALIRYIRDMKEYMKEEEL